MKILLLGATGRTGRLVLQKALEKGHHVNCLARNATRIPEQEGLTIFEGNADTKSGLEEAISGCDSVINVLNISRTSDFPWSRLRTPPTYLSDVMRLLVSVAAKHNLNRISVCSAWGVSDTKNDIPKWFRWFIDNSNIGVAYRDHKKQEQILQESELVWTIVRPVGLTNSHRKEKIRETIGNTPKPNMMISRASVAEYLVDSLNHEYLIGKKVVISKGTTP